MDNWQDEWKQLNPSTWTTVQLMFIDHLLSKQKAKILEKVFCKECSGVGWTIEIRYRSNGEPIQTQEQCNYCHGSGFNLDQIEQLKKELDK